MTDKRGNNKGQRDWITYYKCAKCALKVPIKLGSTRCPECSQPMRYHPRNSLKRREAKGLVKRY